MANDIRFEKFEISDRKPKTEMPSDALAAASATSYSWQPYKGSSKVNKSIASTGTVLNTLATYSNLNAAAGYTQTSFDLTSYKGQTIQIYLVATESSSLKTSFVVDDFALNVKTP